MKYLMITDEDENGRTHVEVVEGETPEKAFEKWFLEEYHGLEWDELDFGSVYPLRGTFKEIKMYEIVSDLIKFDYPGFIDKHDKRTDIEKDPEYKEFSRLKNKFEER